MAPSRENKKTGKILLFLGVFIWLVVTFILWEFVKNAPVKNANSDVPTFFEIIPRSSDGLQD